MPIKWGLKWPVLLLSRSPNSLASSLKQISFFFLHIPVRVVYSHINKYNMYIFPQIRHLDTAPHLQFFSLNNVPGKWFHINMIDLGLCFYLETYQLTTMKYSRVLKNSRTFFFKPTKGSIREEKKHFVSHP